jgi:hypothetical protein
MQPKKFSFDSRKIFDRFRVKSILLVSHANAESRFLPSRHRGFTGLGLEILSDFTPVALVHSLSRLWHWLTAGVMASPFKNSVRFREISSGSSLGFSALTATKPAAQTFENPGCAYKDVAVTYAPRRSRLKNARSLRMEFGVQTILLRESPLTFWVNTNGSPESNFRIRIRGMVF